MLSIVVLGTAAGGGVPQWNCGCPNCSAARNGHPELGATQASIAISDGEIFIRTFKHLWCIREGATPR
jgi:pyrroloquinoline quinone biosynthesis protein B